MANRTSKAKVTFKVGDKVRVLRDTRHRIVKAGSVGVVREIREGGIAEGVCVDFMVLPHPRIAAIFGKDPSVAEPWSCLFPAASAGRMLAKV